MSSSTIGERIKALITSLGISTRAFAASIDTADSSISAYFSGKTEPSYKVIRAIKQKYPSINLDWLIEGKGEMLLSNTPFAQENAKGVIEELQERVARLEKFKDMMLSLSRLETQLKNEAEGKVEQKVKQAS